MKPMTQEEFSKASSVESNWKYNYTRLPLTIVKIYKQHFSLAAEISMWLNEIGCVTLYKFYADKGLKHLYDRLTQETRLEIKIRHDNDYIEVGRDVEDPIGHMFHVLTPFDVKIEFTIKNLPYIIQQLELFSTKKLPINKKLDKVNLDFYTWQRKIKLSDSITHDMKFTCNLKFWVKHIWGSTYNKEV